MMGTVFLIPTPLGEQALHTIPAATRETLDLCDVFFVENERTARRFIKKCRPDFDIDARAWHTIHKAEEEVRGPFLEALRANRTIGILSEAGCPGVADPGQLLVQAAQRAGAIVKPLTGPSSILLALMASGLNGQQFCFHGYLPIDAPAREQKIRSLETAVQKTGGTQIFIETPYRNQALIAALLKICRDETQLCIAANLTEPDEQVQTKTIRAWREEKTGPGKVPVIYLLG